MARKKKHAEHVNHERWLVSYADFITLLFAFFVVMFAVSQVDSKKVGRFSESFQSATEWQVMDGKGRGVLNTGGEPQAPPSPVEMAKIGKQKNDYGTQKGHIRDGLAQRAKKIAGLGGLKVIDAHNELVIRLPDTMLFDVGDADLRKEGREVLDAIIDELKDRPVRVRIEGHTDAIPIHTARFPSNWELSMARAMAVTDEFLTAKSIDPSRLSAAGYGEHQPATTNATPEGRAQNRRVDIVVVAPPPGETIKMGKPESGHADPPAALDRDHDKDRDRDKDTERDRGDRSRDNEQDASAPHAARSSDREPTR
jgi:chemotaxis protein MotB